jgi:hypothetical protein
MMVNCAAVMALDLGLGRGAAPNVMKMSVGPFRRCHPNASSIEARRTFLVCYYLCMSITMVLRRPILLRWTKFMEESVKVLEDSPEALPSDKILCQHIKMAHIGENISVQFCMDDPSVEVAISEPKVIYALRIFESELQSLKEEMAEKGEPDRKCTTGLHLFDVSNYSQRRFGLRSMSRTCIFTRLLSITTRAPLISNPLFHQKHLRLLLAKRMLLAQPTLPRWVSV